MIVAGTAYSWQNDYRRHDVARLDGTCDNPMDGAGGREYESIGEERNFPMK